MRQSKFKKSSIALIASALALTLTGCGAGPNAETRLIKRVTDGNEVILKENGNNISVSNLLLVALEDGSAVVIGTFVNYSEDDDSLVGLSVNGIPAVITGETTLKQDQPLRFEGDTATTKGVFNAVGAVAGVNIPLTLSFERAGDVTVNVIVRDKRDDYRNVTK
jgi:basic membrane lipoprotein Med (substrate-binding protein (PBP1-ABC) superfamily)